MEMTRLTRHLLGVAVFTGFVVAACGVNARAQGSRKDDIVFNAQGRPMAGATVRVCTSAATGQPCSPLGLIYSDPGLTQALANPISIDGLGNYTFYASPGRYEIEISGPSIITKQLPNVILPNDPSSPTFTTVTTTSGISAFSLSLSGNLTVSGSAAITGSLTVGGAPVPSTNQDNRWTAAQRFKGPDPWRDITAYMPAGGCDMSAVGLNPSPPSGTMTGGSAALSINFQQLLNNGCGIFVANAGPASTLLTPGQGTAPNPNVIGAAGSTTVHYKVAAIDANYGTSAASAAMTVTTAPAARTPINYVGIYWQGVANAVGYLVYSDQTGGGTYVPLGYSFDCFGFTAGNVCGIIDKGVETNSWGTYQSFWPATPPAAVTNQALITTIVSGGGTLSLTLAASATNSVSGAFTLLDNSPFFKSAITDASTDGTQFNKGTVFVPEGLWYTSTIPFPTTGSSGVNINLVGTPYIFGLPVEGPLGTAGYTGNISITGMGGGYITDNWSLSCSNIMAYPTLGALFVASGASSSVNLSNVCLSFDQAGIIQDSQGAITAKNTNFIINGSGPALQVDNNAFFSLFERTNWNDGANPSVTNNQAIWFLGLTNTGHTTIFDFRDNSFIGHTIRADNPFPLGGGPTGEMVFDGLTDTESSYDPCFICLATNFPMGGLEIDNVQTGDANVAQSLVYSYNALDPPLGSVNIHGLTTGYTQLYGYASPTASPVTCRAVTYENPNQGGAGLLSIGYFGSIYGSYSGCDNGLTTTGYDVQTSEVLTSGGNDPLLGPAGEQMVGHVFRRPVTALTPSGSGGTLAAGTYYIKVTVVDVAGRESAPSPELSAVVSGSTSSIAVSSVTGIYFPTSCNVYFGTSAGGEAHYWNSTAVTNGTCTFTFTTTASPTGSTTPGAVGNAMRSWLSEENNANSCLFCGFSGGLGTGFLGFNLTAAQYGAPPTGVQFPFNGGVHSYKFYSASETTAPTGIANVDQLYADSTAHRWKKIENNGAVQTVGSADSSACAYQGPVSAVTGTGAAATYYTCALPAGVMGAGQGIIITVVAKHTTGTAAVTYTLSFGGTSTTAALPGGAANQLEHITYLIMNNPGSTVAQTISTVGQDSNGGTNSIKLDTAAVNTASAVTINLQFNVAATDAITPEMFLVELKQ
jgi:hypothetical protein